MAAPHRDKKSHPKPFTVEEFQGYGVDGEEKGQTPEEQLHYVKTVLHPMFSKGK